MQVAIEYTYGQLQTHTTHTHRRQSRLKSSTIFITLHFHSHKKKFAAYSTCYFIFFLYFFKSYVSLKLLDIKLHKSGQRAYKVQFNFNSTMNCSEMLSWAVAHNVLHGHHSCSIYAMATSCPLGFLQFWMCCWYSSTIPLALPQHKPHTKWTSVHSVFVNAAIIPLLTRGPLVPHNFMKLRQPCGKRTVNSTAHLIFMSTVQE